MSATRPFFLFPHDVLTDIRSLARIDSNGYLSAYLTLCDRAAWRPQEIHKNSVHLTLEPGDAWITVRTLAAESRITKKVAENALRLLEARGHIAVRPTGQPEGTAQETSAGTAQGTHGSIVTVTFLRAYYAGRVAEGTGAGTDQATAQDVSGDNTNTYTKKTLLLRPVADNAAKGSKRSLPKTFPDDSEPMRLAREMFALIRAWNPDVREPNFATWARDFDALMRLDGRDAELIREVMAWTAADGFWRSNIMSPGALRGKKSERDKFAMLVGKMRERRGSVARQVREEGPRGVAL